MRRLVALLALIAGLATAQSAQAIPSPQMDGGNGTPGLPACNWTTFGMQAYTVHGWRYVCTIHSNGEFYWLRVA